MDCSQECFSWRPVLCCHTCCCRFGCGGPTTPGSTPGSNCSRDSTVRTTPSNFHVLPGPAAQNPSRSAISLQRTDSDSSIFRGPITPPTAYPLCAAQACLYLSVTVSLLPQRHQNRSTYTRIYRSSLTTLYTVDVVVSLLTLCSYLTSSRSHELHAHGRIAYMAITNYEVGHFGAR